MYFEFNFFRNLHRFDIDISTYVILKFRKIYFKVHFILF